MIKVKRIDKGLPLPTRAKEDDGACDLLTSVDFTIGPGERKVVPTGIAVEIPSGSAGLVIPRSGLAAKHGISIVNAPGLVDAGYRGEVKVILVNLGSESVSFKRADRIAQLCVTKIDITPWVEVEHLSNSQRSDSGFGSTGVASS